MLDTILLAFVHAAFVGVMSCLISESVIMTFFRDMFKFSLFQCPICMGFWFALPFLWYGPLHYFLVVGFSNLWMLIIIHTYLALEQ